MTNSLGGLPSANKSARYRRRFSTSPELVPSWPKFSTTPRAFGRRFRSRDNADPYRDRLVDRLRANPLDREAWLGYCHQHDAELGEAISLATEVLDLASIGRGPVDLERSGPTPEGDLCLSLILHEVSRHVAADLPEDFIRLLRAALRSPETSTRLRAVAALQDRPLRWRYDHHLTIETVTRDPNAMVRKQGGSATVWAG